MKTTEIQNTAYQIRKGATIVAYNNDGGTFAVYYTNSHLTLYSYAEMTECYGITEAELEEIAYTLSHQ